MSIVRIVILSSLLALMLLMAGCSGAGNLDIACPEDVDDSIGNGYLIEKIQLYPSPDSLRCSTHLEDNKAVSVGNDPDNGFALKWTFEYRYWSLPSVDPPSLDDPDIQLPVKVAVVPIVMYSTAADRDDLVERMKASMPSIDVIQEVIFNDNLGLALQTSIESKDEAGIDLYTQALSISPRGSVRQYFKENSCRKMHLEGEVFDFSEISESLSGGTNSQGWYLPDSPVTEDQVGARSAASQALSELKDVSVTNSRLVELDNRDVWDKNQDLDKISKPPTSTDIHDCIIFLVACPEEAYMGARGWHIPSPGLSIGNKSVKSEILSQVVLGAANQLRFELFTLVHEIGHAMGLPDTYDAYDPFSSPMGREQLTGNVIFPYKYLGQVREDEILNTNMDYYDNSNTFITHYSGYEKFLLGWIDNVHTSQVDERFELGTVYDSNLLVIPIEPGSMMYSDYHLFTDYVGSGTCPDDLFIVVENRGYKADNVFENFIDSHGIHAYLVDTSKAGQLYPGYCTSTINYKNMFRQLYFSCTNLPSSGLSYLSGNGYFNPFIGLIGEDGTWVALDEQIGPSFYASVPVAGNGGELYSGVPLASDDEEVDDDTPVPIDIYLNNPKKIFIEKSFVEHTRTSGSDQSYTFKTTFWDTEFAHCWPESPSSYIPSFELRIYKLISDDGPVDTSFTPLTSSEYINDFEITASLETLINGGLHGVHYYRMVLENLALRSTRTDDNHKFSFPFSLTLADAIDVDENTSLNLDFNQSVYREMFKPSGIGSLGSTWQFVYNSDLALYVAYCGRLDGADNMIGYEPNLDLYFDCSEIYRIWESALPAKQFSIALKYELEKQIPNDSVNWDTIGRPELPVEAQSLGDHLSLELSRVPTEEEIKRGEEVEWFQIPYELVEPAGEGSALSMMFLWTETFLNQPGLDVLNMSTEGDKLSKIRLRFTSDDSVQYGGVQIKRLFIN